MTSYRVLNRGQILQQFSVLACQFSRHDKFERSRTSIKTLAEFIKLIPDIVRKVISKIKSFFSNRWLYVVVILILPAFVVLLLHLCGFTGIPNYILGLALTLAVAYQSYKEKGKPLIIITRSIVVLAICLCPVLLLRNNNVISDSMYSAQHPGQIHVADTEYSAGLLFFNDGEFEKAISRFDAIIKVDTEQ